MLDATTNRAIEHLGYCTNVHAGADLAQTRANLQQHALAVKQRVSPNRPMGVGLWLSARAARDLLAEDQTADFAAWLAEVGLVPYTLNGFPYGDFHQPVVKHRVYHPTWYDEPRLRYTLDLIEILDGLLPRDLSGTISTLPIGWRSPPVGASQRAVVANHLKQVVRRLACLEADLGRRICLCLEPEPGCLLQRSEDVVRLFEEDLLPDDDEAAIRRHLHVCHDVCHAAVMFEEQADCLQRYDRAGIGVSKIQVSAAVRVDFDAMHDASRRAAAAQLAAFAEDRYLHQTSVREASRDAAFFDDLSLAINAAEQTGQWTGQWRTHFHVPIYLRQFGALATTQDDIEACLRTVAAASTACHFEVETYAWGVLPAPLQQPILAEGIAEELHWFQRLADTIWPPPGKRELVRRGGLGTHP